MFDANAIRNELHALKKDLADAFSKRRETLLEKSEEEVRSVAAQMKSAFQELSDALEQDEAQLEKLVSQHPVASLGSALALGVVIGLLIRRS